METVKIDKRGKVLIPSYIRKDKNLFAGQRISIKAEKDCIILKPYIYECHDCGEYIPDGDDSGFCKECSRKRTVRIY